MSESESVRSMYFRVKLAGDEDVGESEDAINVGLALPKIEITRTLNHTYFLYINFLKDGTLCVHFMIRKCSTIDKILSIIYIT